MERWCSELGVERGSAIHARTAARLGRLWYADRLSADWKPKTPETMERILAEVGLTDPFWQVR